MSETETVRVIIRQVAEPDDIFDAEGKIIPGRDALLKVEREYPNASPAEKWRLAQAEMLVAVAPRD